VDECMDLRRLQGFMRAWANAPPVHVSVRALFASSEGSSQGSRPDQDGGVEAMLESLPAMPLQVPKL